MESRNGKNYTRIATVVLLTLGCLYVLKPFLPAILFAAAVVISSWPLYMRLLHRMEGRRTLAALTMTLTLTLLVIIPLVGVTYNLADDVARLFGQLRYAIEHGELLPPAWIRDVPLVGDTVDNYLRQLVASREQMLALAQRMLEPARNFLLARPDARHRRRADQPGGIRRLLLLSRRQGVAGRDLGGDGARDGRGRRRGGRDR